MSAPDASRRRPEDRLARRGGAIELLRVPSALFAGLIRLRNALYERGLLPIERLETPVVCVGNLSVGGTGKTPCVIWLAREFLRRGRRPGILSRGYGPGTAGDSDEGRLLASVLPDVPRVEDPDRVRGGRALEQAGVDVILLDDGFQHRRLGRDLDLVLVDATRPWGLPRVDGEAAVACMLPRGLLREAPRNLRRADALILTRCDQVPETELAELESRLRELAPGIALLRSVHAASRLRLGQEELPLDALREREVSLVSGIGNPEAFERTVRELGAKIVAIHRFGDHHRFTREELAPIVAAAGELLVTRKDAVKLEQLDLPFMVLDVELEFSSGLAVLEALLDALPHGRAAEDRKALHAGLSG